MKNCRTCKHGPNCEREIYWTRVNNCLLYASIFDPQDAELSRLRAEVETWKQQAAEECEAKHKTLAAMDRDRCTPDRCPNGLACTGAADPQPGELARLRELAQETRNLMRAIKMPGGVMATLATIAALADLDSDTNPAREGQKGESNE